LALFGFDFFFLKKRHWSITLHGTEQYMLCWKSPGTLESSALMMAQPVAICHALLFDSPIIIPILFFLGARRERYVPLH
jgi:hypothetical protein